MPRNLMSKDSMLTWTVIAFLAAIVLGFIMDLAQPSAGFGGRFLSGLITTAAAVGFLGLLILVIRRYLDDAAKTDAPKTAWIDLYALVAIVLIVALATSMKSGLLRFL